MKKNIHPQTHLVKFSCTSCKKDFDQIISTLTKTDVAIEVCSNCHPFYLGKSTVGRVTGKAEKLINKFETGKATMTKPASSGTKLQKKPKKSKLVQDLSTLDA